MEEEENVSDVVCSGCFVEVVVKVVRVVTHATGLTFVLGVVDGDSRTCGVVVAVASR